MKNNELYIPVILGTARLGRRSERVANFVLKEWEKRRIQSELVDVRDYKLNRTVPPEEENEMANRWRVNATRADGYIIVTPEYNHGYPGELKLLLDQARQEYNRKPVGICGVSTGGFGGVRVVEALRITLCEMLLVPISRAIYFPRVKEIFNDQGQLTDQSKIEELDIFFNELIWYAKTLKSGRDEIVS